MTDRLDPPVCVLGLGLIGGSLLRAALAAGRIGWAYNRSPDAVEAARTQGYDASTDLQQTLRRAQDQGALLVIAVPMPAVSGLLEHIARDAPDCALTDVVSVKAPVAAAVAAAGLSARYVGAHPMAGTAESGWDASDPELFRGAVWMVATDDDADPRIWSQVARLGLDCGSVVVPAASSEHDLAVARISHLPFVLAESLAMAGAAGGGLALGLAAGSFRDGTRVAGTAPDLVRAICEPNADALLEALDETLTVLINARQTLARDGSLAALTTAGHEGRARFDARTFDPITDIEPGSPDWVHRMREAGRRGAALREL